MDINEIIRFFKNSRDDLIRDIEEDDFGCDECIETLRVYIATIKILEQLS